MENMCDDVTGAQKGKGLIVGRGALHQVGHDGTAQELPCLNGQAAGGHTRILYHEAAGEDLDPEKQTAGVAADALHCGLKIQILRSK